MEDGVYHILRVEWDAVTTTLTATIDGDYTLSYSGDLINALFGGDPEVFWGFTSATGGLNNQQGFCTGVYPAISVSESIACPGLPITFSENSVVFGGTTELLWDFGDGTTSVDSIFDHTYSDTGEYDVTLTVTDQNGCSAQEVINVIVDSPTLQLAVSDTSICQGEQVLLDASYVLPEPPPCEFTIEMFDSFGDGWNGCSLLITGDGEELYNITLENGSEGTETFILDPNLLIEMIFIPNAWEVEISFDIYTSNGDILVSGSGFGESEEMVFQGMVDCPSLDNSYVLAWSPVNSLSFSEDSLSATTFPDANSIFEVQLSNDAGCLISESIEVQVSNMIHTDSVTISECNESTGEIFISSIGGLGQYTYSMVDSGWVNLTGEFLDLAPGFYSISVFDETECFSLLEYEVTEDTCALEIFIPNVFTPNGDDVNEAFQIELDGGEDPLMRIYNRWGRLIYETKDVQNGWNGQVAGFNASEGTYFYVVQVTEAINNELRTFKGTMSLLR
jgi:gliding motility-associated-like protein